MTNCVTASAAGSERWRQHRHGSVVCDVLGVAIAQHARYISITIVQS